MSDVEDSFDESDLLAEYLKEEQVTLEVIKVELQKKESFKAAQEDEKVRKEQEDDDIIQQQQDGEEEEIEDISVEIDHVEFDIMDLEGAPEEIQDKRRHTTSPPNAINKTLSSEYNKARYKDTLDDDEVQANTVEIHEWVKSIKIPRKKENLPSNPSLPMSPVSPLSPGDGSKKRKQSYSESIIEECINELSPEAQMEFFGNIRLRESQVQSAKIEKIDPEFTKIKLRQARIEKTFSESTDDGESCTSVPFQKSAESILMMSYRDLVKKTLTKDYSGVDKISLEKSLSDDEFISVFMMDRETFYALPKWKREDAKKKLYLF
jgi:hypothetical protein